MSNTVKDSSGNTIGLLEDNSEGSITISARNSSTIVARYDIAHRITKNYITGEEEPGCTLRSCLKEYLSSR